MPVFGVYVNSFNSEAATAIGHEVALLEHKSPVFRVDRIRTHWTWQDRGGPTFYWTRFEGKESVLRI
jgi:hypothetical protein